MKKLCLILVLIFSCSNGPETIVYPPGSVQPVVTGIIITDTEANVIGIWGNPTSTNLAYPNPAINFTTLRYNVPRRSRVSITAVKARLSGELSDDLFMILGDKSYLKANNKVITLVDNDQPAGRNYVNFAMPEAGF